MKSDLPALCRARHKRHSFALHQLQAGLSIREVQTLLGHKTVETTLRYAARQPGGIFPTETIPSGMSPLDRIKRSQAAQISEIPVDDSVPPFPVDQPARYFLAWLKRAFRYSARHLRLSG